MREPLPVTDEDRRAAWHDFYDYTPGDYSIIMREPDPAEPSDAITLDALERVLIADRKRGVERSAA